MSNFDYVWEERIQGTPSSNDTHFYVKAPCDNSVGHTSDGYFNLREQRIYDDIEGLKTALRIGNLAVSFQVHPLLPHEEQVRRVDGDQKKHILRNAIKDREITDIVLSVRGF